MSEDREWDWNPHFQRRKKRNRVRHLQERARRYFFWPIAGLVASVFFIQAGLLGGVGRGAQAVWASNRESEHQIEKARLILATTDALLQQVQREQARINGERLQQQINEVSASGEGGVITVRGSVSTPIILPSIEAVGEDASQWTTAKISTTQTGTITPGNVTSDHRTVHNAQPTPTQRRKVEQE